MYFEQSLIFDHSLLMCPKKSKMNFSQSKQILSQSHSPNHLRI